MGDAVNLKNGAAIDARFMAVDKQFESVCKDIGRLELRVDEVEANVGIHHDGITKHDHTLISLTKAIDEVTATLREFTDIKNQVQGGIILWKWVLVPIGGFSGILYIANQIMGGFLR